MCVAYDVGRGNVEVVGCWDPVHSGIALDVHEHVSGLAEFKMLITCTEQDMDATLSISIKGGNHGSVPSGDAERSGTSADILVTLAEGSLARLTADADSSFFSIGTSSVQGLANAKLVNEEVLTIPSLIHCEGATVDEQLDEESASYSC
jgi:hypothetical protein